MSLRFIDSFDHYVSADITEKWTTLSNVALGISAGNGRRGTSSLRQTGASNIYVALTLNAQPTWIIGMAVRCTARPGASIRLIELFDLTTTQMDLRLNPTGTVGVTRNGTVLGASTYVFPLAVFVYLEWLVTIHNTTGVVTVRADGATILTLTGQDTQNSVNATADNFRIGNLGADTIGTEDIDDLYICDATGSTNTTFLGDCRVDALLPNGDGSHSAWTPSTGTTHSTLVDETAPNDDTDYLSTSTAAARDSHTLVDLPTIATPTIRGVQHVLAARKDDAGTRQIKSLLKSGGTTQAGATTQTLASTYTYYREIWETDPNTSAAWLVAGVNALEAGFENQ